MSTTEAVKIDAKLVKELREKSGAPMGDCLKALQEAKGDMENAFVVLRKRGMASAAKKASPHHQRRRSRHLHPRRRQDRRPARAQLRVRLRRPHRRLPGAPQGHRHAHRRRRPALRRQGRSHRSRPRAREGHLPRPGRRLRQARQASSRRCSKARCRKFYEEVCLLEQPFIKEAVADHRPAHRLEDRQARRKHLASAASPASKSAKPTTPSPRPKPQQPTNLRDFLHKGMGACAHRPPSFLTPGSLSIFGGRVKKSLCSRVSGGIING